MISFIAFFGCRETGILPHGPEFAAVHVWLDATGEGKCPGPPTPRRGDLVPSISNLPYDVFSYQRRETFNVDNIVPQPNQNFQETPLPKNSFSEGSPRYIALAPVEIINESHV